MTDFTTVNAAVQKLIDAQLAADKVLDDAAIAKLKADSAAALKAALAADVAADAVVLKAKDDEIALLKARIAVLEGNSPQGNSPPSPPPPPPPPSTGFPDATNTGAKGTLTAYAGPMTITVAGTVIDSKTLGALTVKADNVVIKNCQLTFNGWWGIDAETARNLTVQDSTLRGSGRNGDTNSAILGAGNFLRNDIANCENGIVLMGGRGPSVVRGNYIHDLLDGGPDPHYDCIACQGGQNGVLIEGNTLIGYDTAAVIIQSYFGTVNDVTVQGNLCKNQAGKKFSYTLYCEDKGKGPPTNVKFLNNKVEKGTWGWWSFTNVTPVRSGNVDWVNGAAGANIDAR